MPKRRVLLVDDDVAILLTMKAVLEISGFQVDTAASAREGKSLLRLHEYQMVITDMRMESDAAGREVIHAARMAPCHPAIALLTAFPGDIDAEADLADVAADQIFVKPMQTAALLRQIEAMLDRHAARLLRLGGLATAPTSSPRTPTRKSASAKSPVGKPAKKSTKTKAGKQPVARKKLPPRKRKR